MTRWWALGLTLLCSAGAAAACSDDGPDADERTEEQLNILRIRADAPPLEASDTTFYAVRGEARSVFIYFEDGAGGRGSEYFRLEVGANSLETRPDGSPIAPGDSLLISVRVVDPTRILFDLGPDGLTFNPLEPARLILHYSEADHDFDGDGDEDAADAAIELQLSNWRQGDLGGTFVRLTSELRLDLDGVISALPGFSRMAIAY